ncbi:MAG TPA: phage tail protein [Thermoanaerobaculia bacterium]|nr:phage tail protein [Thermoanaerobaculia bacterium]
MVSLGLEAGFSAGAGVSVGGGLGSGGRTDPYMAFNFLVEIEGLVIGGFSEVSGLQVETMVHEYQEGGQNEYVHKLPGPTRYPSNLVFKRGLTDVQTLWAWHQEVASGAVSRRNGTIYLLDRQGQQVMWWSFKEAYPVKWSGPDFRADSNAVATESIELVHRGLSRPAVSITAGLSGSFSASVNASASLNASASFNASASGALGFSR